MTAGGFHRGEGPAPRPTDWNLPNALTVLRFLLVPVYAVLLFMEGGSSPWWRFWAWAVFVLAAVTDGIDGKIARQRGEITNFGKVADPIADKALTGTAFIGLSVLGVIWWWVTVVILVREVGITVLRFVVIRHGVMPAGRGGKLKTMLQTLSLGALTFPLAVLPLGGAWLFVAYVLLGAALVMTVVSGVDYVFKAARLRETSERTRLRRERRAAGRESRTRDEARVSATPSAAPTVGATADAPKPAADPGTPPASQSLPTQSLPTQIQPTAPVSTDAPGAERHTAASETDPHPSADPAGRGGPGRE
ncbi:CDP-diacylglycerol--glycerol-3-phosphate 3-phosphatidyltransferase [Humibacillus xanthopallidus]|uniref:CDP-diacylglycerol--glycerol-3-phosphate 3-phosphatidyltransferase n=1 Tax=Humibacillus xanthopallidus TaxID=412689 RepID=A0A543PTC9_9MICO|nr:CDP-diacylglycerol--glycerol-3-phosphate 3-phosphatidyltransferase [Humibacillus xanthopallidus]